MNVKIYRSIDKTLIIIVKLLELKKKKLRREIKNKKILIIRLWGMGDAINTIPLIKKLSENYSVSILTTNNIARVFEGHTKEINILNYKKPFSIIKLIKKLRKEKFEYIIDTEQFLNLSTIIGRLSKPRILIGYNHLERNKLYDLKVEYSEEKHFVENFTELGKQIMNIKTPEKLEPIKTENKKKEEKKKKRIVIHIGSSASAKARRWPEKKFLEIINKLSEKYEVVLIGTEEENKIYEKIKNKIQNKIINKINKENKEEFFNTIKEADLFIGNDSGPMHVAAAMGVKTIGLFGMNDPRKVGPWPITKNISLYHNPENKPIINNKYGKIPKAKNSTINLITTREVINKAEELLR